MSDASHTLYNNLTAPMPPRVGWHKQDILAAIRKRDTSLKQLLRENGFNEQNGSTLLMARCPNIHTIIADFLGVSRHVIWPQFYDGSDAPRWRIRRDLVRKPLAKEGA
jgi:Ner family transcriptional regulator